MDKSSKLHRQRAKKGFEPPPPEVRDKHANHQATVPLILCSIVLYWRSYLVCIFHPWSFCPVLLVTTENPHLRRFYTGQIWKAWRHELHSGDLHKLKNFPRINIDIMFGLTNLDSTFGLINFVSLSYTPKSLCITNNPHCPHFPNTFWL